MSPLISIRFGRSSLSSGWITISRCSAPGAGPTIPRGLRSGRSLRPGARTAEFRAELLNDRDRARAINAIADRPDSEDSATLRQRIADSAILTPLRADTARRNWFVTALEHGASAEFVNIAPFPFDPDSGPLPRLHISTHWVWRLEHGQDSLRLTPLDNKWLVHALRDSTVRLRYEDVEYFSRVLTATSEDLQALLDRFGEDTAAFKPATTRTYYRWKPGA